MRRNKFSLIVFLTATAILAVTGAGLTQQAQNDETLTITTYYPSPYGSYSSLQTNKMAVGDTNKDGVVNSADLPANDGNLAVAGNVGIGTRTPTTKLDVRGEISIGYTSSLPLPHNCISAQKGRIRYNPDLSGSGPVIGGLEICESNKWQAIGGVWENVSLTDINDYDINCEYRALITDGTAQVMLYATRINELQFVSGESCMNVLIYSNHKGVVNQWWPTWSGSGNCNFNGFYVSEMSKRCP